MESSYENQDFQDELDAATIYNMLENEISPLFYKINNKGLPSEWIEVIRNCIAKVAGNFTTNRMLNDYIERYYSKLDLRTKELSKDSFRKAREIAGWKKRVKNEWPFIEVVSYHKPDNSKQDISLGEEYGASVTLSIGDLKPEEIGVEMLVAVNGDKGDPHIVKTIEFVLDDYSSGLAKFSCRILAETSGAFRSCRKSLCKK